MDKKSSKRGSGPAKVEHDRTRFCADLLPVRRDHHRGPDQHQHPWQHRRHPFQLHQGGYDSNHLQQFRLLVVLQPRGATTNVTAAQVNASYSSKYSYDVTGSSYLKTKLVPVPPPPILEVRIRDLMEIERAYLKANPDQAE